MDGLGCYQHSARCLQTVVNLKEEEMPPSGEHGLIPTFEIY